MQQLIETEIKPFIQSIENIEQVRDNDFDKLSKVFRQISGEIHGIIIRNDERQKITKERFNVFTCIPGHYREDLQTGFIRYLLNPKESHDCFGIFLKIFIEVLKNDELIKQNRFFGSLCGVTDSEIEKALVENKDKYIGSAKDSEIYGKMDVFIEMNSINIVIENKVLAIEQPDQIARYVNWCENQGKPYLVLFLTPNGRESQQAKGKDFYKISYSVHINSWIDECIYKTLEYPMVYAGLRYYKSLVNTYILKQSSNYIIMEMKTLLLRKENLIILKYLKEINATIMEVNKHLRNEFISSALLKLNINDRNFIPLSKSMKNVSINDILIEEQNGFIVDNENFSIYLNKNQKIIFRIEHGWGKLYYGLIVVNMERESYANYEISKIHSPELIRIIDLMSKKFNYELLEFNNGFYLGKGFVINGTDTFDDNTLNYEFASNMDGIVNQFVDEVETYLDTWKNAIEEYNRMAN